METMRTLNRLNDYAFKHLFGLPDGESQLKSFLNAVVRLPPDRQITALFPADREISPERVLHKASLLDILVSTADGTRYLVEVQVNSIPALPRRALYYWATLYQGTLRRGSDYQHLMPVICVNVLGHSAFPQDTRYHRMYQVLDSETGEPLSGEGFTGFRAWSRAPAPPTSDLQIHFLEVPKMTSTVPSDALERWLLYLSNPAPARLEELAAADPLIRQAIEREQRFLADDAEWFAYVQREMELHDEATRQVEARRVIEAIEAAQAQGKAQGKAEGLAEGKAEGLAEGKAEGLAEGKAEGLSEGVGLGLQQAVRSLARAGTAAEDIARLLSLDLHRVLSWLETSPG